MLPAQGDGARLHRASSQGTSAIRSGYGLTCQNGTHFHTATCPHFLHAIAGNGEDSSKDSFASSLGVSWGFWFVFFFQGRYTSSLDWIVDALCVRRQSSWSACTGLYIALASPGRLSTEDWLPASSAAFALLPTGVQR